MNTPSPSLPEPLMEAGNLPDDAFSQPLETMPREALIQMVEYYQAQDGLLTAAQNEAQRLRDQLEEVERPLDAQMARLNKRVIELNEELFAARAVAEGYVLAPHFRGFAHLGTGQYLLNNSGDDGEEPELIISIASEAEKAGRTIGDSRDNPEGHMIQPEQMCVRIRFANVAGLDALEKQLRMLREECFPAALARASLAAPSDPVAGDVKVDKSTVYVLNNDSRPSNLWYASVQPGFDDEGRRLSQEACEAIAQQIAVALSAPPAPRDPVAYSVGRTLHWHEGKGITDAQLYAAPPAQGAAQVTDEQIRSLWQTTDTGDVEDDIMAFARSLLALPQGWRTALEFYANPSNWTSCSALERGPLIDEDGGDKARAALKGDAK